MKLLSLECYCLSCEISINESQSDELAPPFLILLWIYSINVWFIILFSLSGKWRDGRCLMNHISTDENSISWDVIVSIVKCQWITKWWINDPFLVHIWRNITSTFDSLSPFPNLENDGMEDAQYITWWPINLSSLGFSWLFCAMLMVQNSDGLSDPFLEHKWRDNVSFGDSFFPFCRPDLKAGNAT